MTSWTGGFGAAARAENIAVLEGPAGAAAAAAPRGVAQEGQNLYSALAMTAPQRGQGGTVVVATGPPPSLAPQKAQKGRDPSTIFPHEPHFTSALPSAAYTFVAGTPPPPAADARIPAADMAEAESGLPQSMQNREPSSLRRPQWAQFTMSRGPPQGSPEAG
jgi:hypothetical protein